jgi:CBS domain-containing protein
MSVLEVAHYMTKKRIGAVTVVDGEGRPIGVFSERDLMERVVTAGRAPAETVVSEVMSKDVVIGSPDDSHLDCVMKMQRRGCRHLPLVLGGKFVGMLSLRDLLRVELDEKDETIKWMHAYIHEAPPDSSAGS